MPTSFFRHVYINSSTLCFFFPLASVAFGASSALVASASLLSGVLSLLISVKGLPEVKI